MARDDNSYLVFGDLEKVRPGTQKRGVNIGPAPLQKCVRDFRCIYFGGFCLEDFSGHFFP